MSVMCLQVEHARCSSEWTNTASRSWVDYLQQLDSQVLVHDLDCFSPLFGRQGGIPTKILNDGRQYVVSAWIKVKQFGVTL